MNKYFALFLISITSLTFVHSDEIVVTNELNKQVFDIASVVGWVITGSKQGKVLSVC